MSATDKMETAEALVKECVSADKSADLQWRFSAATKRAFRLLDEAKLEAEREANRIP